MEAQARILPGTLDLLILKAVSLGRLQGYLQQHPEGVEDDTLAQALGLRHQQQSNQRCRQLESNGVIERRRVDGKVRNFLQASSANLGSCDSLSDSSRETVSKPDRASPRGSKRWHWEGNVQAAVVRHLVGTGYRITRVADTSSREPGNDIVATTALDRELWVTVKGFPNETERTNPNTQAWHWVAHALFDMVVWRGEPPTAALAVAFPDFATYRRLAQRASWFFHLANIVVYWVQPDGNVQAEKATH